MRLPALAATGAAARAWWAAVRRSPGPLTLDQLRSDLSHETAAKIARLSGLVQEWRAQRFRPADPADADAVLRDLDRIYLRHARLAGARPGTFARLIGLLTLLASARTDLGPLRGQVAPSQEAVRRFAERVTQLESASRALVEDLSSRYGARFGDLLAAVAAEVRRESVGAGRQGVAVVVEAAGEGAGNWVPRRDAAPWADVLRNLVRNAVQATEDRARTPREGPPETVTIRVLPNPGGPGTAVEILDEGVGMDEQAAEAMWRAGRSSHGPRRGHGLTEGKRAFVEGRAALEVRSAVGVGTCVRVALPHRDLPVRAPRLWTLPLLVVPLLAVLGVVALGLSSVLQPAIVDVDVDPRNDRVVRAHDARGAVIWQRDMGEAVQPNYLGNMFTSAFQMVAVNRYLVLPARWPQASSVVLATQPPQGPGHLWRLGAGGRTVWQRSLRWTPPRVAHTGDLKSVFQAPTPWNLGDRQAIALNVRDGDWGSTSLQFVTTDGVPLGAYYHPGHLEYRSSADVDGDGRVELILTGKNNRARADRSFLPEDAGEDYIEAVVMLEPPQVDGQAYPYTGWDGLPPAAEEGYLLIPPLRKGPAKTEESATVWRLGFGAATAPDGARAELQLRDGRIYHLDAHLRPLSTDVADLTLAASLAPTRALAPLLYLHGGRRELIDLPILREP